jgi:hypothetical protein
MAQSRTRARTQKKKATVKESVPQKPTLLFYVFLAATLAYGAVSFFGPVSQETLDRYNLSILKVHLLSLTIIIPLIAIWFSAYYGFSRIKQYARAVRSGAEGPGFKKIADGLGLLAFSLPVSSLLSASFNAIEISHPSYSVPFTITKNYAALVLPLLAFTLICRGSAQLTGLIKPKPSPFRTQELWSLGIITLCSLFSWLLIARPADTRTPLNVYQLPNWLIILTLAVPLLYTWMRGIAAAYYITVYQRNVKGQLYRSSLRKLSAGLMVVIVLNILIQIIISVSSRLYRLELTPLLFIIYCLVALYAVGFGLIASGSKKLKRIEDV